MNIFSIGIFTCASVFVLLVPQATLAWTIDAFDSTIEVFEDASLIVEEEISVDFEEEFKHGIFRNIPTVYRDELGNRVRLELEVLEVLQDGDPANYIEYRSGSDKVIQIGSATFTLVGEHVYTIRYRVDRAMLYFDEYDELYWNVTGTDWEVPIASSTAYVLLPDGTEIRQTACYAGAFGSADQACGTAEEGNAVAFAASDYLTIAVGFEKGVVTQPSTLQNILWFLEDNWIALLPLAFIVFVVWYWYRVGRDPKMSTVIAEFSPPNDLWAVYCAMILRPFFTSADLAGMLVQLGVKGYIQFDVQGKGKKDVVLKKKKSSKGLDAAHKDLYDILFRGRDEVHVKELKKTSVASHMMDLRKDLNRYVEDKKINVKYSRRRRDAFIVIGVLCIWLGISLTAVVGIFTAALFFLAGVVSFVFGFLMPKRTLHGVEVARKVKGFKLFLHTAERYRSQWQEEQSLFEELLPYAIVFGHTKQWAKAFQDVPFQQPDWYTSAIAVSTFDDFASSLSSVSQRVASVSSPSSSGSSGGGSVGGGFGGGGGGSW